MVRDAVVADIDAAKLYAILRLRAEVFVVEQACAYLDPDGRDLEPGARLLWIDGDAPGEVVATARVLDEGDRRVVGRIATAPSARGQGLGALLLGHFLATTQGPWSLEAQSRLVDWYAAFGFEPAGPEYLEDGIPHTHMRRPLPPPPP